MADLQAGIDELERRVPGPEGGCGRLLLRRRDDLEPPRRGRGPAGGGGPVLRAVPRRGRPQRRAGGGRSRIYGGPRHKGRTRSRDAATAALEAAGLEHEIRTFEGADHAFFNDTGPRYDAEAAAEAYNALLAWFGQHLPDRRGSPRSSYQRPSRSIRPRSGSTPARLKRIDDHFARYVDDGRLPGWLAASSPATGRSRTSPRAASATSRPGSRSSTTPSSASTR